MRNLELCKYTIGDDKVYRYTMPVIRSNMYILIRNKRAIIIDPNISDNALELLQSNKVEEATIILSHEHYDHISGVNFYREILPCTVIGNRCCEELVEDSKTNLSAFFLTIFMERSKEEQEKISDIIDVQYSCKVDKSFTDSFGFMWEGLNINLIETPGHSMGSICILIEEKYLFSGDSLVPEKKIVTRLPGGCKKMYQTITKPLLESLEKDVIVFPGHGAECVLGELDNI